MSRRASSLPFVGLLILFLGSCSARPSAAPDLPASVSPGWSRSAFSHQAAPPAQLSKDGAPDCWKADYSGPGLAHVWACRYQVETNAFEAVQRTRTDATTVKFQEGPTFVLVTWEKASREEITDLIRAVQKALKAP